MIKPQEKSIKITAAMRAWLVWIAAGGVIERTAFSYPEAVRCHKKITWAMLDKLESAGLIVWSDVYITSNKHNVRKWKVLVSAYGMTFTNN